MSYSLVLNILRTLLDISLVWLVLYLLLSVIKKNIRTLQLFKGVLFILLMKIATSFLGLSNMDYLVDTILTWGFLALVIIFQPEIRSVLEKIGQTKLDFSLDDLSFEKKEHMLDELVSSITTLSQTKTGALITFEKTQSLADYIQTGTRVDADIKEELINSIFYEGTPLHDGAMIIKDGRIACAAAFFPPTKKDLSTMYGARHRAAIGISEVSDSLTVVVSEETGTISFAKDGQLIKVPRNELKANLIHELAWIKLREAI